MTASTLKIVNLDFLLIVYACKTNLLRMAMPMPMIYDYCVSRPTVCDIVPEGDTCAGAGTAKPSDQKNDKA
jgi:hypothetical protein